MQIIKLTGAIVLTSMFLIFPIAADSTANITGNQDSDISVIMDVNNDEKKSEGKGFFSTLFNQIAMAGGAGLVGFGIWFAKKKLGNTDEK